MPDPNASVPAKATAELKLALEGDRDPEFLSDLISAERFKAFLIGRGVEVADEIIDGLAQLSSVFQSDVDEIRAHEAERLAKPRWRFRS